MVLAEWVAGCLLVVAHNEVVRTFADRPGHVAVVLVARRATVARFFNDLHRVNAWGFNATFSRSAAAASDST